MRRASSILAAFAMSPLLWGFANKDVPSWVEEVASRKLPVYSGKVPAAVLLDEQHVTFDASGQLTTLHRGAIKVLTQEGKKDALVRVHYWKNRREIKDLHAWVVAPNGFEKAFDKNSVYDVGDFESFILYQDGRSRAIVSDAEIGAVFAYEYTVESKALTAQDEYVFQSTLPSLLSRYTLTLPAGWTAKAQLFNQAPGSTGCGRFDLHVGSEGFAFS